MYTLNRAVEVLHACMENLEQALRIQWDNETKTSWEPRYLPFRKPGSK